MPATASERLAAARAAVDDACRLLLSPTPAQMDASARLLENAIRELNAARDPLLLGSFDQTRLLQKSIGRAAKLLEGAAAFHANWIRFLGAWCAGYTGEGQPASVDRGARLLARG